MATFVFILFLILGLTFFTFGIHLIVNDEEYIGILSSVFAIIVLIIGVTVFSIDNTNKANVEALLESGKYEIVTNEDYSLKELKQFICIDGVYLKEVEE